MKRNITTTIIFLYSVISVFGQISDDMEKIDIDYFDSLKTFDEYNIFIVKDLINLNYIYDFNPNWVGARDENFKVEIHRQVRIKVNNLDSNINFMIDNSTCNKTSNLRILSFVYYVNQDGKIIRTKIKPQLINIDKIGKIKSINLNSLEIPSYAIIDIGFEINELSKDTLEYNYSYSTFVYQSKLAIGIPEIYRYRIEPNLSKNIVLKSSIQEKYGILVGYGEYKLMSPAFYDMMKGRDPHFTAPPVNCRIYENIFEIEEYTPQIEPIEINNSIIMYLNGINPIGD
jgi:hypothetical protein